MGSIKGRFGLVWLGVLAVSALGGAGCAAPQAPERMASTQSKYLVPDPILSVNASSETKGALGIAEWRSYRGRGGMYLTGYSDRGKAVMGLSTEFVRDGDGNIVDVLTRVNDGEKFAARTRVAASHTVATAPMPASSQKFVQHASRDFSRVRVALDQRIRAATVANPGLVCSRSLIGGVIDPVDLLGRTNVEARLQAIQAAANASNAACQNQAGLGMANLGFLSRAPLDESRLMCSGDRDCLTTMDQIDAFDFPPPTVDVDGRVIDDGPGSLPPGLVRGSTDPLARPGEAPNAPADSVRGGLTPLYSSQPPLENGYPDSQRANPYAGTTPVENGYPDSQRENPYAGTTPVENGYPDSQRENPYAGTTPLEANYPDSQADTSSGEVQMAGEAGGEGASEG
jgi:hypothetical protein